MKIDVQRVDQFTANISIEIEPERATAEYNKACRRLSQRINVPGFRRGKAPRQVVEKNVGVEKIKQEVLERILPHAFADAISENQLDVVAPPNITDYTYDFNQPIKVSATVELRPEVTLPEISSIDVKVPKFSAPDENVDTELQAVLQRLTTLEPVIDRAAEPTDIVNINFAGAINGELIRGGTANNYQLDLGDNNFIEGFSDQIIGHSIGEEFTISVKFPEDYHDNTLKGKPAVFTIKINEIKKKIVPELNDETVKKLGTYQTVDDLKNDIRKYIDQRSEEENQFRAQKTVIEAYVEKVQLELPDSLVNREAKVLMKDVQERFKQQGLNWEQYAAQEGPEKIMENFRQEAKQRLKTSLSFTALAKQQNVQVSQEEYQNEVNNVARMRGVDEKIVFRELANNPNGVQALLDHLVSQKVASYLMSIAKIEYYDAPAEDNQAKANADASSVIKEPVEALAGE